MIYGFDKEEFMNEPVFATIEQNIMEAIGPRGNAIHPFTDEQSIVIHVGGQDYDVRDLENEGKIITLENQVDTLVGVVKDLKTRLEAQEDRIF